MRLGWGELYLDLELNICRHVVIKIPFSFGVL